MPSPPKIHTNLNPPHSHVLAHILSITEEEEPEEKEEKEELSAHG